MHLIKYAQEANVATQKKLGEINNHEFEKLTEVFAPNVKDHDPADDQGSGPQGFVQWFAQFHSAFPDSKIAVEHMVSDNDNVAFAYPTMGTQDGPFNGIPATGKGSRSAACRSRSSTPPRKLWALGRLPRSGHPAADRSIEAACASG